MGFTHLQFLEAVKIRCENVFLSSMWHLFEIYLNTDGPSKCLSKKKSHCTLGKSPTLQDMIFLSAVKVLVKLATLAVIFHLKVSSLLRPSFKFLCCLINMLWWPCRESREDVVGKASEEQISHGLKCICTEDF